MEGHSKTPQPSVLRREVESPQRHDAGIGVMLIASASMFFAVASSAFILRSQMPVERCFHDSRPTPVVVAEPVAEQPCGEAVYQPNADGTVSVLFDVCKDASADTDVIDVELVALPSDASPSSETP